MTNLALPNYNLPATQPLDSQWSNALFNEPQTNNMEMHVPQPTLNNMVSQAQTIDEQMVNNAEPFSFFWPSNDISGFGEGFDHGFDAFLRAWGAGTGRDNPYDISPKSAADQASVASKIIKWARRVD